MDNRIKDVLIEKSLKSQPLAPMPKSAMPDILLRIQKDPRPNHAVWIDLGFSLVVALCVGALLFSAQALPPVTIAKIRIQGILFYQDLLVNARWLIPVSLFSLAVFFSALTIPLLRQKN